jgi:hypothetical protein
LKQEGPEAAAVELLKEEGPEAAAFELLKQEALKQQPLNC